MSNLIERRDRLREAVPHLATASGSIASFQTDIRSPLEEIKIHFNPQQASGTPSPSSPIPIYGWTGCDIFQTKKNLFDISNMLLPTGTLVNGVLSDTAGNFYAGFTQTNPISGTCYKTRISISAKGYHTGTTTSATRGLTIRALYDDGTVGTVGYWANTATTETDITGGVSTSGKKVMCLYTDFGSGSANTWHIKDIMVVEYPDSASYEPFVGNQIPVSWSSLGEVGGGYVNPITGEVWADFGLGRKKLSDADRVVHYDTGITMYDFYNIFSYGHAVINNKQKCNVATYSWSNQGSLTNHFYGLYSSAELGNRLLLFLLDGHGLSDDTYIEFSSEIDAPVLIGTISPIALKTLVGANNIWSNANGITEVKFWTH